MYQKMIVRRLPVESCLSLLRNPPIKQYVTTYVWAQDGWLYDTTANIRRQYFTVQGSATILRMYEEATGVSVVPNANHMERLTVTVHSRSPLVWTERGENYEEAFVEQEAFADHSTCLLQQPLA